MSEAMGYDEDGNAQCPECSGVTFHLILLQGSPFRPPAVECCACGTRLKFSFDTAASAAGAD